VFRAKCVIVLVLTVGCLFVCFSRFYDAAFNVWWFMGCLHDEANMKQT